ncbi:MAG: dihydrodipicolinate synthase family protein [Sphaerobacter sp.]|nr:dihydrodipicolinate synthase family protein [Sphaerobacter sp.]
MGFEPLRGVYNILSTPFTTDGELDEDSLRRLVEATIAMGVDGITILGVAGEAQKLSDAERRRVIDLVMEVNAGRVPIIVGVSRDGTRTTIEAAREAEATGAAGLMIAPPTFLQPGPALTRHFREISEAVNLPIVLQDFPPVNGVTLSPAAMADLANSIPAITTIKLEDTPTPQRVAQTLALLKRDTTIVGGIGGVYLLDELRRGGSGTMTGFAFPEILIAIWRAWTSGDQAGAAKVFYRYLPILVFEGQPKIGVAIRKEILRRRGLIASATVRQPGPALDEGTLADLTETLAAVGLDSAGPFLDPARLV